MVLLLFKLNILCYFLPQLLFFTEDLHKVTNNNPARFNITLPSNSLCQRKKSAHYFSFSLGQVLRLRVEDCQILCHNIVGMVSNLGANIFPL